MNTSIYNNSSSKLTNTHSVKINRELIFVNILYSIKLKEFNDALYIKFGTAALARISIVILNHFKVYSRNIKYDLMSLYNIHGATANKALKLLLDSGYIRTVKCKRKTNLGLYVELDSYQITVDGVNAIKRIELIFEGRLRKLSR